MTRIFHHVIFAWITIQAVLIGRAGCSDFHSSSTTSAAYANKGGRGPYTDFGDKYDSTQTKQIANRERSGNGGFFGDFLNEFIHQARGFIYQSLQFVGDNPWILLALLAPAIHHWVGTIGLEVVSIIARFIMAAIQAYLGGYSFDRFLLELAPINGMERYILKGAWELWTAMNS